MKGTSPISFKVAQTASPLTRLSVAPPQSLPLQPASAPTGSSPCRTPAAPMKHPAQALGPSLVENGTEDPLEEFLARRLLEVSLVEPLYICVKSEGRRPTSDH